VFIYSTAIITKLYAEVGTTHMMNICAKFHCNPSTTCRYITSRRIYVDGRTTWEHVALHVLL